MKFFNFSTQSLHLKILTFLVSIFISACSGVPEEENAGGSTSYQVVEVSELSIEGSQKMRLSTTWDFLQKQTFQLKACIVDTTLLEPMSGVSFEIVGGPQSQTVRADSSGCIRWSESLSFNRLSEESFVEIRRTLRNIGSDTSVASLWFALNPWNGGENALIDLNFYPDRPENIVSEGHPSLRIPQNARLQVGYSGSQLSIEKILPESHEFSSELPLFTVRTSEAGTDIQEPLFEGEFSVRLELIEIGEDRHPLGAYFVPRKGIQNAILSPTFSIETDQPSGSRFITTVAVVTISAVDSPISFEPVQLYCRLTSTQMTNAGSKCRFSPFEASVLSPEKHLTTSPPSSVQKTLAAPSAIPSLPGFKTSPTPHKIRGASFKLHDRVRIVDATKPGPLFNSEGYQVGSSFTYSLEICLLDESNQPLPHDLKFRWRLTDPSAPDTTLASVSEATNTSGCLNEIKETVQFDDTGERVFVPRDLFVTGLSDRYQGMVQKLRIGLKPHGEPMVIWNYEDQGVPPQNSAESGVASIELNETRVAREKIEVLSTDPRYRLTVGTTFSFDFDAFLERPKQARPTHPDLTVARYDYRGMLVFPVFTGDKFQHFFDPLLDDAVLARATLDGKRFGNGECYFVRGFGMVCPFVGSVESKNKGKIKIRTSVSSSLDEYHWMRGEGRLYLEIGPKSGTISLRPAKSVVRFTSEFVKSPTPAHLEVDAAESIIDRWIPTVTADLANRKIDYRVRQNQLYREKLLTVHGFSQLDYENRISFLSAYERDLFIDQWFQYYQLEAAKHYPQLFDGNRPFNRKGVAAEWTPDVTMEGLGQLFAGLSAERGGSVLPEFNRLKFFQTGQQFCKIFYPVARSKSWSPQNTAYEDCLMDPTDHIAFIPMEFLEKVHHIHAANTGKLSTKLIAAVSSYFYESGHSISDYDGKRKMLNPLGLFIGLIGFESFRATQNEVRTAERFRNKLDEQSQHISERFRAEFTGDIRRCLVLMPRPLRLGPQQKYAKLCQLQPKKEEIQETWHYVGTNYRLFGEQEFSQMYFTVRGESAWLNAIEQLEHRSSRLFQDLQDQEPLMSDDHWYLDYLQIGKNLAQSIDLGEQTDTIFGKTSAQELVQIETRNSLENLIRVDSIDGSVDRPDSLDGMKLLQYYLEAERLKK